ncbi:Major sperm protein [Caenorhabditis elegans]|uniref:Major sperm protein n=1 Tax=Caenorhabditis elegans TaxID=6239 RepID=O45592_CAEEL|nr:Major sperm protein [Caenorhabditis elegans]CAB09420.1 Major sperm protein [Caenorhabditis elegans]|eukprot:NP_506928.1 Major sperm protein [Caenorhabditis elegans]
MKLAAKTFTPSTADLPFTDAGASEDSGMANKPGEPAFQLWLDVKKVVFPTTSEPSYVNLRLHNPTDKRITFKVRCTSAELFRVQPPIAFINAGATVNLVMWSANTHLQPEKKHYFAFYHKNASPSARQSPPLWKDGLKDAEGVRRIPVVFLPPSS